MSSRRQFLSETGGVLSGLLFPAALQAWGRRRRCQPACPPPCAASEQQLEALMAYGSTKFYPTGFYGQLDPNTYYFYGYAWFGSYCMGINAYDTSNHDLCYPDYQFCDTNCPYWFYLPMGYQRKTVCDSRFPCLGPTCFQSADIEKSNKKFLDGKAHFKVKEGVAQESAVDNFKYWDPDLAGGQGDYRYVRLFDIDAKFAPTTLRVGQEIAKPEQDVPEYRLKDKGGRQHRVFAPGQPGKCYHVLTQQ
jgi:hypothetical protein